MEFRVIDINDDIGNILEPQWLKKSEIVHRQLRPHLPANYSDKMRRVFSEGGRMTVLVGDAEVVGVAVYRVYENTALGRHMYVDDLVTNETKRSLGLGRTLIRHLENLAREKNCIKLTLDSGTHRQHAHKFYFREGFLITSFHFHKQLHE